MTRRRPRLRARTDHPHLRPITGGARTAVWAAQIGSARVLPIIPRHSGDTCRSA